MNYQEFFTSLLAVFKAMLLRGDYIKPELLTQLKQLRDAPIFDNDRAALTIAKYETRIEDLLENDIEVTPYSDEIRELMCACLQELRGEIPQKPPAIRHSDTYQKITKKRASLRTQTKILETA